MGPSAKWLKSLVDKVVFDESIFEIKLSEYKYIFRFVCHNSEDNHYFSISTIYDTIINLVSGIKYSFYKSIECDLSEMLEDHNPFNPPKQNEIVSLYYIENMIFRTLTLWDLLAQLYNIHRKTNKPIDKIYAHQLFHDCSQGKKADLFAKEVYEYMKENDHILGNLELWGGNYTYVKNYRDKMTHRNSPSITALSTYDKHLRAPAIFILKRVTEDFLVATEFIQTIIKDIKKKYTFTN